MSKYAVMPLSDYVATCEEIKNRLNNHSKIKSGDMPIKISEVYNTAQGEGYSTGYRHGEEEGYKNGLAKGTEAGYQNGYSEGKIAGTNQGIEQGIEQGKQAQYDEFCDTYYDYGKREDFNTAFAGEGWTNDIIPLKYDIKPTLAYMMFRGTRISGDLKALFESRKIVFDTSNCRNFGYMFNLARGITKVGVLDLSSVAIPPQGNTDTIFNNANALEEIELIRTSNEVFPAFGKTAFYNLNSLVKIRFEGVIADDISFAHSPLLDEESRQNIIDCLADLTGGTAKTLTFHSSVVVSLTTEQLTTIANKNWSIG